MDCSFNFVPLHTLHTHLHHSIYAPLLICLSKEPLALTRDIAFVFFFICFFIVEMTGPDIEQVLSK